MDWWKEVEANWTHLVRLIEKYHPNSAKYDDNLLITAPNAEKACQSIRREINESGPQHPVTAATMAKENKDGATLHSIFQEVWFGMPESSAVRREPGFGIFCDLCSEYPDGPEEIH